MCHSAAATLVCYGAQTSEWFQADQQLKLAAASSQAFKGLPGNVDTLNFVCSMQTDTALGKEQAFIGIWQTWLSGGRQASRSAARPRKPSSCACTCSASRAPTLASSQLACASSQSRTVCHSLRQLLTCVAPARLWHEQQSSQEDTHKGQMPAKLLPDAWKLSALKTGHVCLTEGHVATLKCRVQSPQMGQQGRKARPAQPSHSTLVCIIIL